MPVVAEATIADNWSEKQGYRVGNHNCPLGTGDSYDRRRLTDSAIFSYAERAMAACDYLSFALEICIQALEDAVSVLQGFPIVLANHA